MGPERHPAPMSDDELVALIDRQIEQATGEERSTVSNEQADLLRRYLAEPYGDEVPDRSKVVSTDVSDTIESILPDLIEIFAAADEAVKFEPVGPEDEEQAAQETEALNHEFYRENQDGFLTLYTLLKDALLLKNAIVKVYWHEEETTHVEEYADLDGDALLMLHQDFERTGAEYEILEWEPAGPKDQAPEEAPVEDDTSTSPQPQPAAQPLVAPPGDGPTFDQAFGVPPMAPEMPPPSLGGMQPPAVPGAPPGMSSPPGMPPAVPQGPALGAPAMVPPGAPTGQPEPIPPVLGRLKLRITERKELVRWQPVPGDEFGIAPRHNSVIIDGVPFCFHRTTQTVSDLIEQNYDPDQVRELPDAEEWTGPQETARHAGKNASEPSRAEDLGDAMRRVAVYECYARVDYDGDGIAELRKITLAGNEKRKILNWAKGHGPNGDGGPDNEEVTDLPFIAGTPILMTHRFWGRSVAELVTDIQKLNTVLWRNALDNLYATNNPTWEVAEPGLSRTYPTIDQLLAPRPGKVIVTGLPGHLIRHDPPNVLGNVLPAIEYANTVKENRTGVTRYNQGLDAESLNKTATGITRIMDAATAKKKLIARILGETLIKPMFLRGHKLLRTHASRAKTIRLRRKWVAVDPRHWRHRSDLTVNVGLGSGDRTQQQAFLMQLLAVQREILVQGGGMGGMVTPKHLHNTLAKMVENAGYRSADAFFADPDSLPDPGPPPPSPEEQKVQAEAQAEQQRLQMEAEAKQAEMRMRLQEMMAEQEAKRRDMEARLLAEVQKAQASIAQKWHDIEANLALQERKLEGELRLRERELAMEADLKAEQLARDSLLRAADGLGREREREARIGIAERRAEQTNVRRPT